MKVLTVLNRETSPAHETTPTAWTSNEYIQAATSENTRKAYQSDIRHYEKWGGRLPATPELITLYLHQNAALLNPRTLARRLTALKNWHVYQGFVDPTQHPIINKTLAGIVRTHGKPKQKAHPLLPEDLYQIVFALQSDTSLQALRDSALLQLAFFGAFRRSEVVNIHIEHISWQEQGIEILLPSSKTDQTHEGQYCAIPFGNEELCAIKALKHWLEAANIHAGPVFRRVYLNEGLSPHPLSPLSVNQILQKRANAAGLSHKLALSSHSLRRGLATSASRVGAPLAAIMRQGRWKQVNTVMEYIEASERFKENAAASIFQDLKTKE